MTTILAPPDPSAPVGSVSASRGMRGDEHSTDQSVVRQTVTIFLVLGLAAMILVFIPSVLWIRTQALDHTLDNIAASTQRMAAHTLAPFVDEALLDGDPQAQARLDEVVDARVREGALMRVKIIDRSGEIVFSNENRLIGQQMQLAGRAAALFEGGRSTAAIEEPHDLENEFETGVGSLVEVYTIASTAAGVPLIFEAYYPADAALAEQRDLFLLLMPGVLLALVVLQAAQLPLAIWLAKRVQSHQALRRKLLRQAVSASDLERRRIARDLHDDVIQDLAGLSYALESIEMRAAENIRPTVVQARTILQQNVSTLRGMLTELYPADLHRMGLPKALNRLVRPLHQHGVDVDLEVPDTFDADPTAATLLYRVAREALVNTVKHAGATSVSISLRVNENHAKLRVTDNGIGFDTANQVPDGHFGLRLAQETVAEAGGTVDITSRPGEGTCVTTSVPLGS